MTTLLLSLTSLFFASWVVILKICLHTREKKLVACEDAVHMYCWQSRGENWSDTTHNFVQSLKIALKGEC